MKRGRACGELTTYKIRVSFIDKTSLDTTINACSRVNALLQTGRRLRNYHKTNIKRITFLDFELPMNKRKRKLLIQKYNKENNSTHFNYNLTIKI